MAEFFKVELSVLIPVEEAGDERTAIQMAHAEGELLSSYCSTVERPATEGEGSE